MNFKTKILLALSVFIAFIGISILVKSVITDLNAADSITPLKAEGIFKTKVEHFDIANDFYYVQEGKTSWYGRQFHNRKTSSGEKYDMFGLSAAHRYLPFGSIVRVTNAENQKTVLLRVNDRGPFVKSKILDLSYNSALEIDGLNNPEVKIETLLPNDFMFMNRLFEDYYFGYSFDFPLVCLPQDVLKFLDSSTDFNEAVSIYKEYCENLPNKFVYLMVSADYKKFRLKNDDPQVYYICLFDSNDLEFADKIKN